MKVKLDRSGCIGCGLCAEACPEVFKVADDGLAQAYAQPEEDTDSSVKEAITEAKENCPAGVITTDE